MKKIIIFVLLSFAFFRLFSQTSYIDVLDNYQSIINESRLIIKSIDSTLNKFDSIKSDIDYEYLIKYKKKHEDKIIAIDKKREILTSEMKKKQSIINENKDLNKLFKKIDDFNNQCKFNVKMRVIWDVATKDYKLIAETNINYISFFDKIRYKKIKRSFLELKDLLEKDIQNLDIVILEDGETLGDNANEKKTDLKHTNIETIFTANLFSKNDKILRDLQNEWNEIEINNEILKDTLVFNLGHASNTYPRAKYILPEIEKEALKNFILNDMIVTMNEIIKRSASPKDSIFIFINVLGYASPEGNSDDNLLLSINRAKTCTEFTVSLLEQYKESVKGKINIIIEPPYSVGKGGVSSLNNKPCTNNDNYPNCRVSILKPKLIFSYGGF